MSYTPLDMLRDAGVTDDKTIDSLDLQIRRYYLDRWSNLLWELAGEWHENHVDSLINYGDVPDYALGVWQGLTKAAREFEDEVR